jgi:hypothetical protein
VHRAVDALPVPCNGFHLVVLGQPGLPQSKEEARLLPLLKVRMDSTGAAELAWKSLPLATRAQHIHDGGEDLARRHGLAATARLAKINAIRRPLRERNERLNLRPKRIRNSPRLDLRHPEMYLRPVCPAQCVLFAIENQDRYYLRISS